VALLSVATPSLQATETQRQLTIYVGPQSRQDFADVDRGVLDSIKDIKSVVRKRTKLRIVEQSDGADLQLYVIRRGKGDSAGTVGIPVGNLALFVSIDTLAVETVLHVGDYEKSIVGVEDQWQDCAGQVVNHLKAWLEVNGARIK
jgi:hypothetical protein